MRLRYFSKARRAAGLVLAACFASAVMAQERPRPVYAWSFDQAPVNARVANEGTGRPGLLMEAPKWSSDAGAGGGGALECDATTVSRSPHFPKLAFAQATIELSFKPAKPDGRGFLLDYAETSYGGAAFSIFLDGKGHVGASLTIKDIRSGKVWVNGGVLSKEREFKAGEWTTVRVTMRKGGAMCLFVDGQLEMRKQNGPSLADFAEFPTTPPDGYPFLSLGRRIYDGTRPEAFTGWVDNVRVWDKALDEEDATPAAPEAGARAQAGDAVLLARATATAPLIDGMLDDACWKEAETTRPFDVLQHLHPTITGEWLKPDEKFFTHAATAQVCHDGTSLYVAFRAPVPPGMEAKAAAEGRGSEPWRDDCVELFLDPMRDGGFRQIIVNAKGAFAEFAAAPGGAAVAGWDSKAQVKATRDEKGFLVEMAIPFASLGSPDFSPGTGWRVNFTREGSTGGGLSTWAPVGRVFATPSRFGLLVFDSRKEFLLKDLKRLDASLAAGASQTDLAARATKAVGELRARIEREGDSSGGWSSLRAATASAEKQIQRLAAKGRTYMFWKKDVWGAMAPDECVPVTDPALTAVKVFAAQNMLAQTGFALSNLSEKPLLGRFRVAAGAEAVKAAGGANLLDASRLRMSRGVYLELGSGEMAPDVMMPLPYYHMVEAPAQTSVPLWVAVDTRGLAAGRYVREVEFIPSYSGFAPTKLMLDVEVAPVDLDAVCPPSFMYLSDPNGARDPVVARDLVSHGVNTIYCIPMISNNAPTFDADGTLKSYDWSTLEKNVDEMVKARGGDTSRMRALIYLAWSERYYRDLGTETTVKFGFGTDGWKRAFRSWSHALRDFFARKGFGYEQIAFITVDESCGDPADPKTTACVAVQGARYIKEADPKFRVMCNPSTDAANAKYLPAYIEVYDILQPYFGHAQSNPAAVELLRKSGRELWVYGIYSKDTQASAYRNLFWFSAANGFAGSAAVWYLYNSGDPFNSHDSHHSNVSIVTDYTVSYLMSGAEAKLPPSDSAEPLPSRRWEAWRQGGYDFKTVSLCRGLIARLEAAGKGAEAKERGARLEALVRGAEGKSCEAMDAAREAMIRMAAEMQACLSQAAK